MQFHGLKNELRAVFSETPLLWIIFLLFILVPVVAIIVSRIISGRPIS